MAKKLKTELLATVCANNSVEVFHVDADTARANRKREGVDSGVPCYAGWYYWACSVAFGPFTTAGKACEDAIETFRLTRRYEWFVNLDERGEFFADLRDELCNTVYQLNTQDAAELVQGGFLRNVRNPADIQYYLREIGLIDSDAEVVKGN